MPAAHDATVKLVAQGREVVALAHHDPQDGLVLADLIEREPGHQLQELPRVLHGGRVDRGLDLRHRGAPYLDRRLEQRGLAGEVLVEPAGTGHQARRRLDLAHGRAVVALAAEQLHRRVQDSLPGGGWRIGNHSFTDGTRSITRCRARADRRRSSGCPSTRPRTAGTGSCTPTRVSSPRTGNPCRRRCRTTDLGRVFDRGAAAAGRAHRRARATHRPPRPAREAGRPGGRQVDRRQRAGEGPLPGAQPGRPLRRGGPPARGHAARIPRTRERDVRQRRRSPSSAPRWERKLKRLEGETRKAAAALGTDLDRAIAPLDESKVGKRRAPGRLHRRARWARPSTAVPRARASHRATRGGRFSANARTPSRKSSLRKHDSRSSISSRSTSSAAARPRGAQRRAGSRLLPAQRERGVGGDLRGHATAPAPPARPGSTTWLTRPISARAVGVHVPAQVEELGRVGGPAQLEELAQPGVRVDQARAWPAACPA